jgi:hypothetical protein
MLLYLEDMFKNASQTTRCSTKVRTNRISRGYFDIIYEVLAGIEKMDPFVQIKPDFAALNVKKWNYIKV